MDTIIKGIGSNYELFKDINNVLGLILSIIVIHRAYLCFFLAGLNFLVKNIPITK